MRKSIFILLAILVLAFVLRFWGAWNQDILGDEAADAFRSVGYLDYLGTSFQTQPIDWYKDAQLPFWTKLSFHDFPPLAILIQHAFFSIFGDSILVARLPAILFGVGAVFLIYLITKLFFSEALALLAAFLFAINGVMVWIFRTSLLEPILLFFILLNIYSFFCAIGAFPPSPGSGRAGVSGGKFNKYWWVFGGTLGLVALTKYTGVFIAPVYIFYLLLWNRGIFKNWRLYAAFALAILLFSPVAVYNFYLYKTTGHFDLQIAYLLGQNTPEWTGLLGKIQSPFSEIWKNLTAAYGIPGLIVVAAGLLCSIFLFIKNSFKDKIVFVWLYLFFSTLLFVKIGVASRFLALYGPAFVMLVVLAVQFLWDFKAKNKLNYAFKVLAIAFVVLELIFAADKNFLKIPDYGVTKLDQYFTQEFKNKESAVIPGTYNLHLTEVVRKFAQKKSDNPADFFMIVYNDNIALSTIQWVFYRRLFYHSIPTFYVENFVKALQKGGADSFKGFSAYFVQSTENTLLNPFKTEKTAGLEFENRLKDQGLEPVKTIYGQNNLPMFRVYKFSL